MSLPIASSSRFWTSLHTFVDQHGGRAHRTPIAVNQLARAFTPLLRCFGPDRELARPYREGARTKPCWNHSRCSRRLNRTAGYTAFGRAPPTMNAEGTLCSELERRVEVPTERLPLLKD